MSTKDDLSEERDAFKEAMDAEYDNRTTALEDLKFGRLGEQWAQDVVEARAAENRPVLTFNFMPAFMRQVVNDARMNRPQIKVSGIDNASDPATADILSGIIRNIEYRSKADVAYDVGIESAVSAGFGYARVNIDYEHDESFNKCLTIDPIHNAFSVYGDPNAKSLDGSDWNRGFITSLVDKEDFATLYPDAEESSWEGDAWAGIDSSWMRDEQVMVCESWRREEVPKKLYLLSDGTIVDEDAFKNGKDLFDALGISIQNERQTKGYKVSQRLMTGAEIIKETAWAGKFIPIVPFYGEEINIEGKRYFRSLINQSKDAQRMSNYWRTMATETVALAPKVPWIGEEGAFSIDPDKWGTSNAKSWAYLEVKKGKQLPQRQPLDVGPAVGAITEADRAHDAMKAIMGIYDASLGNRSNETSGVAINSRKLEGDVSTFHFHDNQSRAIRHIGAILVDLIPHVYTSAEVVRILGPDKQERTVKIGQRPQGQPATPQQNTPQEQMQSSSPNKWKDEEHIYDLNVGKYDVAIDTGPSFTTRREETAAQMLDFLQKFPQAAPFVGDLLVSNLDWANASEIADRLRTMLPPQINGGIPPQMQQMIQQGQQKIQQLSQENEQLKGDKSSSMLKARADAYKVETERLALLVPFMPPEVVQGLMLKEAMEGMGAPDLLGSPAAIPQGMPMPPMQGQMPPPVMPQQQPQMPGQ